MYDRLRSFITDDNGQDLIEYAMLAAFIALVAVLAVQGVGTGVNSIYGDVEAMFPLGGGA